MSSSGFAGREFGSGQEWRWNHISNPNRVKLALVHAAAVLSTRDRRDNPTQVLSVDMRPLVLHLLDGLRRAGIERAVLTLGENANQIKAAVQEHIADGMMINYVHVPASLWRNLANSVMMAKHAFPDDDPFLIIRAEQLYDWQLLSKVASIELASGTEAYALIDTASTTLHWAAGAHCSATCKNGKCHALVKVQRYKSVTTLGSMAPGQASDRIAQLGHRLDDYDAVVAGDIYVTRPRVFKVLERLSKDSMYYTTSGAMAQFAAEGTLASIEVGDLTCHWFGSKTVIAAFRRLQLNEESQLLKRDPSVNSLAFMAAAPSAETPRRRLSTTAVGWKHVVNAAIDLLKSNATVRDGVASNELLPLLELGAQIGQGANCQVIEAAVGQHKEKPAMGWPSRPGVPSRLAVKVYLTGHSADRGAGAVMRDVMWEVHVLRKIQHENIVKLCDVVEFIDACYVVMERYEGPCLQRHILTNGSLEEGCARRFFCQLLAALRHAHSRGFLHCDVKPENVRLSSACDRAILVDWGMARSIDNQPEGITAGTPAYASPEQLTGHTPEQAWGSARLGPSADVWSLGVTLVEMLSGEVPFRGDSFDQLVANVVQLRYALPPQAGTEVRALVQGMLVVQPSERSTVAELCADGWVLAGGDLPPAIALAAPSSAYSGRVDVGRAGGRLRELMHKWQQPLLGCFYSVLIGGALLWHHHHGPKDGFDAFGHEEADGM